jgi:hypothetical protein
VSNVLCSSSAISPLTAIFSLPTSVDRVLVKIPSELGLQKRWYKFRDATLRAPVSFLDPYLIAKGRKVQKVKAVCNKEVAYLELSQLCKYKLSNSQILSRWSRNELEMRMFCQMPQSKPQRKTMTVAAMR